MVNRSRDDRRLAAPALMRSTIEGLAANQGLDAAADKLAPVAEPLATGRGGEVLRGQWLGHALHPLLSDLPLGCWLSAALLDCVGGRSSRRSARRLIGLGLVFSLPTAASGLVDWSDARRGDPRVRRVGVVHGVGNLVVAGLYLRSWNARRRGSHLAGLGWGFLAGGLALVTGWLGGHMAIAYGAAGGERGLDSAGTRIDGGGEVVGLEEASHRLGVPVEQVRAMVAEGMLEPVGPAGAMRFRSADVEAVRLLGG